MTDQARRTLEQRLGYVFKNKELLNSAFTHSSFVNEHRGVANERLEFLGDCVLDFLVGVRYFRDDPTAKEGELTARRASVVSRAPLARLVNEMGLIDFLRVGAGVDKSKFDIKTVSDIYEAVLGAIYLDGELDAATAFLDRTFFGKVKPERNYKSELQELAAKSGLTAVYETRESETGDFVTTLKVGGRCYRGTGKSKHISQINAAKNAIDDCDGADRP